VSERVLSGRGRRDVPPDRRPSSRPWLGREPGAQPPDRAGRSRPLLKRVFTHWSNPGGDGRGSAPVGRHPRPAATDPTHPDMSAHPTSQGLRVPGRSTSWWRNSSV